MINHIKSWLKKSGAYYSEGFPFHGAEIIDSLNPFDVIIEDPEYPLSKIYRENVFEGIIDLFEILMGDHYDLSHNGQGRVGILDLLIFPLISRRLMGYTSQPTRNEILSFFAFALGYILAIPRGILAIGLTLALSPLVCLVHSFAYFKAKMLYKEIGDHLQVRDSNKPDKRISLGQWIEETNQATTAWSPLALSTVTLSESKNNSFHLSGANQRSRRSDRIIYYPDATIDVTDETREENLRGIEAIQTLGLWPSKRQELKRLKNSLLLPKKARRLVIIGGIFKEQGNNKPLTLLNPGIGNDSKSPLSMIFDFAGCATPKQEAIAKNTRESSLDYRKYIKHPHSL